MRLRHITGSENYVKESPKVIHDPSHHKGRWNAVFGNDHPIRIEIGMGKGQFIEQMALENPEINYIGIERYDTVLMKALKKWEEKEKDGTKIPNLYFMSIDARLLGDVFEKEEIDRIYLNFSDPWPKKSHANRRLTSPVFMKVYQQFLRTDGQLEFKTDNEALFTYSLEAIPTAGWHILAETCDLHHDPSMNEGNIMTEYEEKFSSKGNPICKLIASR